MKKIVIGLLVIASMFFILLNSEVKEVSASENDFIKIETIEDLYGIRNNPAGNYQLMNDLDFMDRSSYANPDDTNMYKDVNGDGYIESIFLELTTGRGWTGIPIFQGVIDGNGYTIKNLYSKYNTAASFIELLKGEIKYSGPNADVVKYAEVKRLGFENPSLFGLENTATIAGMSIAGKISEVYVKDADISGVGRTIAGIAGEVGQKTIIENNYVTGDIYTTDQYIKAGGIVGRAYNYTKITNNYTTATLKGVYNINGIIGEVYGLDIFVANNINFSDYINASKGNSDRHPRLYQKDYSAFSRYDTRITVKNVNGGVLAEYDTKTIGLENGEVSGDKYDKILLNESGRFQGIWMTYDNFKDESFFTSGTQYDVVFDETVYAGGFTEKCFYIGVKTCEQMELGSPERDFYEVGYWDFENTWQILSDAMRPTLKVFGEYDKGEISTAPVAPSNLLVAGSKYTEGNVVSISWNQAFPVKQQDIYGLYYDIYISEGLVDDYTALDKINSRPLVDGRDIITIGGISKYTYKLDDKYDSDNMRFILVAHNGGAEPELAKPIFSNSFAIDNRAPIVAVKMVNNEVIPDNNKVINKDFALQITDSTSVIVDVKLDGKVFEDFVPKPNSVYSKPGTYTFVVTDSYGRSSDEFVVTLNKTIPTISVKGKEELGTYAISNSTITASVEGSGLNLSYTLNGGEVTEWKSGDKFDKDGLYIFTAIDEIGNAAEYQVIVDKENPYADVTKKDEKIKFSFSELIVEISYDGRNWETLNAVEVEMDENKITDKFFFKDSAGSVSSYSINDNGNSTLNNIVMIASIITSVIVIGAIVYIIVQRRRGM